MPRLQKSALKIVPVNLMAELVGKHRLNFLGSVVIKQSIREYDPPRTSQAGEGGIRFLALFGELPAVHSPHPRARMFAEQNQAPAQIFIFQRLELVKDWEEHHRRNLGHNYKETDE